jgi:DNA helicase II / ATP-dependent DNA helicase PcrA
LPIAPAPLEASPAQRSREMPDGRDEASAGIAQGGLLQRADVRDVLAWMRLLVDPTDAAAVVRALSRPPIELRQTDLARVIQLARRQKLDLVLGLAAAIESPQVPPEARERIQRFLVLHRAAAAELDALEPDRFIARLIDRLNGRGVVELTEPRVPSPEPEPEPEPAGQLEATLDLLREEVIASVTRIGGRLGELRLDTELDVSHGVVRYLELLKLSALLQRPRGQSVEEALADINARLLAAVTPLQREIFQTSTLDHTLGAALGCGATTAGRNDRALAQAIAPRDEHSLAPFLPRNGVGLALSASDIQTYRSCPLRYKFARVLRIPTEQTIHQRFGIVVHQVLERYHSEGGSTLEQMLDLLDSCWRRARFGEDEHERELRGKALTALTRYHQRLGEHDSQPVWFERQFSFRLGPHHLRGRVDRVDRLCLGEQKGSRDSKDGRKERDSDGREPEYELIDYKTGRPCTAEQLKDDVQLSLYALAAREDWHLESSRQAYYYVLDDVRVPVPHSERDANAVTDIVLGVGEGILAQEFEPTPSRAACSICNYRIVCPAAES